MQGTALNLDRITELQTQLLKIIEDTAAGKMTAEEAEMKSAPLNRELDGV